MPTISMNVSFEGDYLLQQIGKDEVRNWLERQGFVCVSSDESSKYVNIERSMGTTAFYKLIVDAIESGKLSLEMIVGHVATRKLLNKAENVAANLK